MIAAAARAGMIRAAGVVVARIEPDAFVIGRQPVENAILRECRAAAQEKKKGPQETWKSLVFHGDFILQRQPWSDGGKRESVLLPVPVLTGREATPFKRLRRLTVSA
jgi:hypothetical protein